MTEIDPIKFIIDTTALLVRARKVEFILTDLCKIAESVNLSAKGNPPDFEFRLKMKADEYIGVGTDPKDAILMSLKRAKAALGEAKENAEQNIPGYL